MRSRISARPRASLVLAALLGAAATGCATRQVRAVVEQPGDLPPRAEAAGVPFFPQERYQCGPAALAMVLGWSGVPVTPDELTPEVYTPGREGTLAHDLLGAARRHGRLAVRVRDLEAVLAELAAGRPVLVFQNLGLSWAPEWHYAVAVGYDLPRRHIRMHSGLDRDLAVNLNLFDRTWARTDRWALVVLPPDTLPVRADEADVLAAAAGLERAGRPADAATAYARIIDRWPDSLGAHIGLGNAQYARGDLAAAERAFRAATDRFPDSGAAWNNLAHVLAERGDLTAARDAARTAVQLGGPTEAIARKTLDDIDARLAAPTP